MTAISIFERCWTRDDASRNSPTSEEPPLGVREPPYVSGGGGISCLQYG